MQPQIINNPFRPITKELAEELFPSNDQRDALIEKLEQNTPFTFEKVGDGALYIKCNELPCTFVIGENEDVEEKAKEATRVLLSGVVA